MRCDNCKANIEQGIYVCPSCGFVVDRKESISKNENKIFSAPATDSIFRKNNGAKQSISLNKPKKNYFVVACIVVIVVGIFGIMLNMVGMPLEKGSWMYINSISTQQVFGGQYNRIETKHGKLVLSLIEDDEFKYSNSYNYDIDDDVLIFEGQDIEGNGYKTYYVYYDVIDRNTIRFYGNMDDYQNKNNYCIFEKTDK